MMFYRDTPTTPHDAVRDARELTIARLETRDTRNSLLLIALVSTLLWAAIFLATP
jgi:hypothetical protein